MHSATAKVALAAGAIALGAMTFAATAHAASFQQSCITNPGACAAGAVRGVYNTERHGADRYEICSVYDANNKLLGLANVPNYAFYNRVISPPARGDSGPLTSNPTSARHPAWRVAGRTIQYSTCRRRVLRNARLRSVWC
jgi:hypothetical protein